MGTIFLWALLLYGYYHCMSAISIMGTIIIWVLLLYVYYLCIGYYYCSGCYFRIHAISVLVLSLYWVSAAISVFGVFVPFPFWVVGM